MAKEAQDASQPQAASPSSSATKDQASSQMTLQSPTTSIPTNSASADPLTQMLSQAMSKARVSETSGAPLEPQVDGGTKSSTADSLANSSATGQPQETPTAPGNSTQPGDTKSDVPSFLLSIISKEKDKSLGPPDTAPLAQQQGFKEMGSTQAMLLNSLTGTGPYPTSTERRDSRPNGLPLSAELLPASVMPSGLYPSNTGTNAGVFAQKQTNEHPSPNPAMGGPNLLSRPNGIPAHGSPMQVSAFAYSPGMMPSPLIMPPMQGGPLMRPPPPPMPFQHPMMGPSMGMPPPPQQPPLAGSSFPADAMHAAMGAVGFMQQQQRGFVGQGTEVLSKSEFSQQFLGLLGSDPQFMDVLYSNYTAVLARRG